MTLETLVFGFRRAIETAKANNLKIYEYLTYVLEENSRLGSVDTQVIC